MFVFVGTHSVCQKWYASLCLNDYEGYGEYLLRNVAKAILFISIAPAEGD